METITQIGKVLYTAKTHTIGGREHGISKSSDGRLEIKLSPPGNNGVGTNPEQLFAAGWSACFEGAMGICAGKLKTTLPEDSSIDAEISLCNGKEGYFLEARLNITIPGMERAIAQQIINYAEKICPYSKAIKNNVKVEFNLV